MALLVRVFGRNMRPISVAMTTRSSLSSSRQPNSTLAATEDEKLKTEYERAKPFAEIPGPKGLPYFGTLHQYRLGKCQVFTLMAL